MTMESVENQELLEFLLAESGGKDEVLKRFFSTRLATAAASDQTLDELLDAAAKGGWREWLGALKVADIGNVINPPNEGPRARRSFQRLGKDEKEALYAKILEFIGLHPWSGKSEIAEAASFPAKKLGPHVRALKDAKKIKSSGEKAAMRYAVVGDKTKPPA